MWKTNMKFWKYINLDQHFWWLFDTFLVLELGICFLPLLGSPRTFLDGFQAWATTFLVVDPPSRVRASHAIFFVRCFDFWRQKCTFNVGALQHRIFNKRVICGVSGDPWQGSFSYLFGVPIQGLTFLDNIFLDNWSFNLFLVSILLWLIVLQFSKVPFPTTYLVISLIWKGLYPKFLSEIGISLLSFSKVFDKFLNFSSYLK